MVQVKVWCTRQESSALNIDMKANICCVKYNPGSSNYIAVSSDILLYSKVSTERTCLIGWGVAFFGIAFVLI